MTRTMALLALALLVCANTAQADDARFARERAAMIDTIKSYGRSFTRPDGHRGVSDNVLTAMARTQRHLFVPEHQRSVAYADAPLPIGLGQTISQPLIVAMMTELADPRADHTVLEIGTGSGYQAAILSQLARKVCTVEIIKPLAEEAAALLKMLGHDNVSVRIGDGYRGWPECGPFDSIVVTAALDHVPQPLLDQLKVGGHLVMPVGPSGYQQMTVVEKIAPTETRTHNVGLVRFVPFTREKKCSAALTPPAASRSTP